MITFADVGKVYPCGQCSALQNISFTIDKGEVVFLTGHSGAGKRPAFFHSNPILR